MKKLPDYIWKLTSLRELHFRGCISRKLDATNSWELPDVIGLLQNVEVLRVNSSFLRGQLPYGVGSLPFLRFLDLSDTGISEVPKTISMLPPLQRIKLMGCDKIQELPTLPTSLTHLYVSSKSLSVVPDLLSLSNLVELLLSDGGRHLDDKLCTGDLWWIGSLLKPTKLHVTLHKVPIPAETASLPLLKEVAWCGLDLQASRLLPTSLQKLTLDDFSSKMSISPDWRNLSRLELYESPVQEIQLDGLQLPQLKELLVRSCNNLERLRLSRMRKLKDVEVSICRKLVEIQFSWALESLEALSVESCSSFKRIVYESANELISCEGRLILPSSLSKKLRTLILKNCHEILDIQVVGASESWDHFDLYNCCYLQSLDGLSYLKNLKSLSIKFCGSLHVVEGVDDLESLGELEIYGCGSLEWLNDVSTPKLPNDCRILIHRCWKLREVKKGFSGSVQDLQHSKVSLNHFLSFYFQFS